MSLTDSKKRQMIRSVDQILTDVTSIKKGNKTPRINAVIAGICDDKENIYLEAKGTRNVDTGVPAQVDDILAYFSCTKTFTVMAMMKLYEEGKVNLDIPVKTYLPLIETIGLIDKGGVDKNGEFKVPPRKPQNDITLRQLAIHTAGFSYAFMNRDYMALAMKNREVSTMNPTMDYFKTSKMPLLHEPGSRWMYGHNTDWLGLVIEKVAGMSLDAYMKQVIFDPIGMTTCSFHIHDQSNVIKLHRRLEDKSIKLMKKYDMNFDPEVDMGGQGCFGSVGDFMKFMRIFLNEGFSPDSGVQVFSKLTMKYALQNHLPLEMHLEFGGFVPSKVIPGFKSDGFSLTGNAICSNPLPTGRPEGTLYWGGLANLYYWIDIENKIAGYWGSQMFPYMDIPSMMNFAKFEYTVYAAVRASKAEQKRKKRTKL